MTEYRDLVRSVWNTVEIHDGSETFLASLEKIRPEIAILYAAHFCQSEVRNGGFTQFFWNSTGVLAPEAVQGFTAIGQGRVASVVQSAMDILGQPYVRDRADRQAKLNSLFRENVALPKHGELYDYSGATIFPSLDEQFKSLLGSENGGFSVAADTYAAKLFD
jgi:Domain of unknown function (DUF4375)